MSQELLYTSAPKGLRPGSRGFCTVVTTRGMSGPLATALESLSAYRPVYQPGDPSAANNPIVWSHVKMPAAGKTCNVLSRVADYGLDYSQRTNKLAHHVVIDPHERAVAGPSWLLLQSGFMVTAWDGETRVLPAGRTVRQGDQPPKMCTSWQSAAGDAGWAGVLAESFLANPERPAYLVFRPGMELLSLFNEAIALLPADRRWEVTFSTYFTNLPPAAVCNWRCVLAESPEAQHSRRFVNALRIDLCEPMPRPTGGDLVEIARTGIARPSPATTSDELQTSGKQALDDSLFEALELVPVADEVHDLVESRETDERTSPPVAPLRQEPLTVAAPPGPGYSMSLREQSSRLGAPPIPRSRDKTQAGYRRRLLVIVLSSAAILSVVIAVCIHIAHRQTSWWAMSRVSTQLASPTEEAHEQLPAIDVTTTEDVRPGPPGKVPKSTVQRNDDDTTLQQSEVAKSDPILSSGATSVKQPLEPNEGGQVNIGRPPDGHTDPAKPPAARTGAPQPAGSAETQSNRVAFTVRIDGKETLPESPPRPAPGTYFVPDSPVQGEIMITPSQDEPSLSHFTWQYLLPLVTDHTYDKKQHSVRRSGISSTTATVLSENTDNLNRNGLKISFVRKAKMDEVFQSGALCISGAIQPVYVILAGRPYQPDDVVLKRAKGISWKLPAFAHSIAELDLTIQLTIQDLRSDSCDIRIPPSNIRDIRQALNVTGWPRDASAPAIRIRRIHNSDMGSTKSASLIEIVADDVSWSKEALVQMKVAINELNADMPIKSAGSAGKSQKATLVVAENLLQERRDLLIDSPNRKKHADSLLSQLEDDARAARKRASEAPNDGANNKAMQAEALYGRAKKLVERADVVAKYDVALRSAHVSSARIYYRMHVEMQAPIEIDVVRIAE